MKKTLYTIIYGKLTADSMNVSEETLAYEILEAIHEHIGIKFIEYCKAKDMKDCYDLIELWDIVTKP